MTVKAVIQSQYLAALEMLKQAIERCPAESWQDPAYKNQFWHIAFHVLFYTHLYLQPVEGDFVPWEKHRPEYRSLRGSEVGRPAETPYTQAEILEYLALCQAEVAEQVPGLDLDGPSGFDWLSFNKLEVQFYNIRHIQQHTGELCERLGSAGEIEIPWIGMKPAG